MAEKRLTLTEIHEKIDLQNDRIKELEKKGTELIVTVNQSHVEEDKAKQSFSYNKEMPTL